MGVEHGLRWDGFGGSWDSIRCCKIEIHITFNIAARCKKNLFSCIPSKMKLSGTW